MSHHAILPGPSATFSCLLFTTTYTSARLSYTPSLLLSHILATLQALFSRSHLPILYTLVFATTLYTIHMRLCSLEGAAQTPQPVPKDHTKHLVGILRNTLQALKITQDDMHEVVRRFEVLGEDMDGMDGDMMRIVQRVNLVSKTLAVVENNVEVARDLLGTGAGGSEDGWEMGDDVQVFWLVSDGVSEDGEENMVEEDMVTDVGESDVLVEGWLERCSWPEECHDA
jgi:hypothetical protein